MNTENSEKINRMPFDPSQMAVVGACQIPDEWNRLTSRILACAFEVHSNLGPGLREKLYEAALVHELREKGMRVAQQVSYRITYKSLDLGLQVVDIIVEDLVILELKSVAALRELDSAQLVGYLRLTGLPLGLLINFHVPKLKEAIVRKINWPPVETKSVRATQTTFYSVSSAQPL